MSIPRPEHPKPQFQRKNWMNLNGAWEFAIDNGRSGQARKLAEDGAEYDLRIEVPFCPQSRLSGLQHKDFLYGVWYRRTVNLSAADLGGLVFLHVGAADWKSFVFVNGKLAGTHEGGYVSFRTDITDFVHAGENTIVIYCEDDERDPMIPRGKQSEEYYSHGCDYTRTTGIFGTVWLEFVPKTHIESVKYFPDPKAGSVLLEAELSGVGEFSAEITYEGQPAASASVSSSGGTVRLALLLSEIHLWEPGCGRLYDVILRYGEDEVHSYFGLRSVRMDGYRFLLNEKAVFQRLVLDQGFYPDGVYTAPSDRDLAQDIALSMACGFNGARLHQKTFEERFLYHADRAGYLVWGEYGNWGLDHTRPEAVYSFLPEWLAEVRRDFNHPSVIGWCPFNETWDVGGRRQYDPFIALIYDVTKAADPTRPVIDTSGNYHVKTDIFDVHDYEQDPEKFKSHFAGLVPEDRIIEQCMNRQTYEKGQPLFVSEYGGIRWSPAPESKEAWGYGNAPKSPEEYQARYKVLTETLLRNPKIMGFCYTQLTDVEQEQNGVYTFDRQEKFPAEFYRSVNAEKAAIEEETGEG
ncbi:MAG: beta-galactosidase [Lachnospiraceae bacterium]|nr:beta-galactosidase [Lachnospiraceae bacterium]